MPLSRSTIEELIQVVKEEYGEDWTYEQATQILQSWVRYFDLLAKLDYRNNENETDTNNGI